MNRRPQNPSETDTFIEEGFEPHANLDTGVESKPRPIEPRQAKILEKQLRITLQDLEQFGFSERCPRCNDLSHGRYGSKKNHTDQCRLRIYMHYQETNHPKWRAVKHLFEPDEKFEQSKVDAEGASSAPRAMDGSNLFEDASAIHHDGDDAMGDAEAIDAEEALRVAFNDDEDNQMAEDPDEGNVADLFGDFDMAPNEDGMVDILRMAGITEPIAVAKARDMFSTDQANFVEVYGTSIRNHLLTSRRNLNIEGLDSLDIRTLKPNGQPWDFNRRSDRKEARELIDRLDPTWLIGSPPCTAFSIWNLGMNYRKMKP